MRCGFRWKSLCVSALISLALGSACVSVSVPPDLESRGRAAPVADQSAEAESLARDLPAKSPVVLKRGSGWAWVEVRTSVVASDQETPGDAQKRVLAKARAEAVEAAGGVSIKSGLLSFEQADNTESNLFIQELTSTRVNGLIAQETILTRESRFLASGQGQVHSIAIRAKVLYSTASTGKRFGVRLGLNRTRFRAGEEVQTSIESDQEGFVYLLGLYEDSTMLLLPNEFVPNVRIEAGSTIQFPSDTEARRGIKLIATVPKGQSRVMESVLLIVSKKPIRIDQRPTQDSGVFRFYENSESVGLHREFIESLGHLEPDEWSFDQVGYEIVSKI